MKDLKRRDGFNGLWSFNTFTNEWKLIDTKGIKPTMRQYHAGGVLGGVMLVVGGHNTEAKAVLDDFNLFDFQSSSWVKVRMVKHSSRQQFHP